MTILPIVIAPDARLKMKSLPVERVDDALRRLMDDMLETMVASNGIGLAAVQVGVHKRVLVMDVGRGSERYGEVDEANSQPLCLINPEITEESDEQNTYEEGCLSFPGQFAEVMRPKRVRVNYLDYDGNAQTLDCDGLLATCLQHEIDHLDGKVFVDHISPVKRDMILRKVKKAQKQAE